MYVYVTFINVSITFINVNVTFTNVKVKIVLRNTDKNSPSHQLYLCIELDVSVLLFTNYDWMLEIRVWKH